MPSVKKDRHLLLKLILAPYDHTRLPATACPIGIRALEHQNRRRASREERLLPSEKSARRRPRPRPPSSIRNGVTRTGRLGLEWMVPPPPLFNRAKAKLWVAAEAHLHHATNTAPVQPLPLLTKTVRDRRQVDLANRKHTAVRTAAKN